MPSILIIDDHEMLLEVMQLALEDEYLVHTARSGEEALGMLELVEVDVIITDMNMSGMNGLEFVKRILYREQKTENGEFKDTSADYTDYAVGRSKPIKTSHRIPKRRAREDAENAKERMDRVNSKAEKQSASTIRRTMDYADDIVGADLCVRPPNRCVNPRNKCDEPTNQHDDHFIDSRGGHAGPPLQRRRSKIILYSAMLTPGLIAYAKGMGIAACLPKPFELEELRNTITRILNTDYTD